MAFLMPESRFKVTKSRPIVELDRGVDEQLHFTTDAKSNISKDKSDDASNGSRDHDGSCRMALYEEDLKKKGRLSQLLGGIASYQAAIAPVPEEESGSKPCKKADLGAILGVYLPCIQNIFGVMYFVRLSWIVGTAGALSAFAIVFICCCVSLLTAFSMSAIATNGVVTGGGTYFMISRCLGPEFGGAVGILFYLGLSVSVAMYLVGSIEILLTYMVPSISIFGNETVADQNNDYRIYGTALVLLLAFVVLVGVKFVTKVASFTLAFVIVSIVCIYIGMFTSNTENSIRICVLGDRVLPSRNLKVNNTIMCTKNETGPVYDMFCNSVNDSKTVCDPYFEANDVRLIPGIPGIASGVFMENLWPKYTKAGVHPASDTKANKHRGDITTDIATSFIILLAIYFPSITGFEQGSNYSGDLKDAQKSIPVGTLWAVISTSFVYLSSVLFFAACIEGPLLRDKFGDSIDKELVIAELAWPNRWVIVIGSFQSTVGAGLQALTGAPRLLQAIAKDNVIPFLSFFSVTTKNGEPIRCLVLTTLIAEVGILIAKLDYVAPIVTMFFLLCYGFINLACALQTLLRLPHWRPRFWCYHWSLSLMGLALCLVLMFISSWYYAIIAIMLAVAIYKYVEYIGAEKEWGDGMTGLAMSAAQHSLFMLKGNSTHSKNWRPQLLLLVKPNAEFKPSSPRLMSFASQLKAGKGLTLISSILEGNFVENIDNISKTKKNLDEYIEKSKLLGFSDVVMAQTVEDGICHVIQNAGLGMLRHNTVLLAWPEKHSQDKEAKRCRVFLETMKNVEAAQLSLLVVKGIDSFPDNSDKLYGTMDIWWIVHDGGLLMLLPFLLRQNRTWKNCALRIFTVAQIEDNSIQLKEDLVKYLYQLRITAEVTVVEMYDQDISAYIYERTLKMEQRTQLLNEMNMSRRKSDTVAQTIVDRIHRRSSVQQPNLDVQCQSESDIQMERQRIPQITFSETILHGTHTVNNTTEPTTSNVNRMYTAVTLNQKIKDFSSDAQLVIINLPAMLQKTTKQTEYMEYLEVLTEGLQRILMVHGSGCEVITIYS